MTIAGKLNALVVTVVLCMSVLVSGFSAVREYELERDRVLDILTSAVRSRSDLPLNVFKDNREALQNLIVDLQQMPAVYYGVAYDAQGQQLASYTKAGVELASLPMDPSNDFVKSLDEAIPLMLENEVDINQLT